MRIAATAAVLGPIALAASGLWALAPATPAAAHGWGCGHGWRAGCYVTPQYFRYRPPNLAARCFASRWSDVHCPYSERPSSWRGCWMNRYGRMVCRK